MTPQAKKARELFDLYLNVGMGDGWAKDCAIIAVDEILNVLQNTYFLGQTAVFSANFWIGVKNEINKL